MPSKKKKYNARFPAGRIKKIMQSDEEIGKVAQAVPVIISRTLELFVESLLGKTLKITNSRNAKTLSTSHMKQCIMSEQRFDFLRDLVKNIPDISIAEEAAANYNDDDGQSSPEDIYHDSDTPHDLSMPSTSMQAIRSNSNVSNGSHMYQRSISERHTASNSNNSSSNISNTSRSNHINLKRSAVCEIDFSSQNTHGNSSVIKHTTSVIKANADCLSSKLSRADSAPCQSQISYKPQIQQTQTAHTKILKHQTESLPNEKILTSNNEVKSQPNVMPAPIVNFDFCNTPVIKIDYSNMPLSTNSSPPLTSAKKSSSSSSSSSTIPPADQSLDNTNVSYDFVSEPIINIDLSNLVNVQNFPTTSTIATMKSTSVDNRSKCKAIASGTTESTTAIKPINHLQKISTLSTIKTNSILELDEDYDNI